MRKKDPANAERQKQNILKAAVTCFNEKGLHKTSMRDIAQTAEISLGNIYRYYENKEALMCAFMEEGNVEYIEALEELDGTPFFMLHLKAIMKAYYLELSEQKTAALYMEVYSESLRQPELQTIIHGEENSLKALTTELKKAAEANKITLSLSPEATANAIEAITDHYALQSAVHGHKAYPFKDAWKTIKQLIQ